jgi:hypothetical protein
VREPGDGGGIGMERNDFPVIDIELTFRALRDFIEDRSRDLPNAIKKQKKFLGWMGDLDKILAQIDSVEKVVIPAIESDLNGFKINNRNLVFLALMQPSVKKLIEDIQKEFGDDPDFSLTQEAFDFFIGTPMKARSFAWAGDNVINTIIFQEIWNPEKSVKQLHDERKDCEENKKLSDICNHWKLFENRLQLDTDPKRNARLEKIKGTLVEAIMGVIYFEGYRAENQNLRNLILRQ